MSFDTHLFSCSTHLLNECLLCAELDISVFGADISTVNTCESARNIPRNPKTILGGNVMDLEPLQSWSQGSQSNPTWLQHPVTLFYQQA